MDGLSSVASAVWENVVKVTGAVFDAVSQTLHIVFDGLDFVVSAVPDTIERVMDAVSILLDAAGFILGMAVNWVLEQLGFLFDWPEIKRRRSQMKQLLYAGAPAIQKIIPDPMIGATFMLGQVESMRTWLMQYSSKSSPKDSWGLKVSGTSLPGLFTLDGVSALPPVTWLMDKLRDRLFTFQGGEAFDFAEFAKPQAEAMRQLMLTSQSLNLSMDDMKTLVVS